MNTMECLIIFGVLVLFLLFYYGAGFPPKNMTRTDHKGRIIDDWNAEG